MNIKFNLIKQDKDPKSDSLIYLWVFDGRFDDRKFKRSTGKRIHASEWDAKNHRAKIRESLSPREKENLLELNKYLKSLKHTVEDFEAKKYNSKSLVKDDLHEFIKASMEDDLKLRKEEVKKETDFFKLWQSLIDGTRVKGVKLTANTIKSKQQTLNKLADFALDTGFKPTFQNLDKEFYSKFVNYLENQSAHRKDVPDLKPNSVGKHIKEVKAILREADDQGKIEVNQSYLKKSFSVIRKPSPSISLNIEDLEKIRALKLKGSKAANRDVFVMACFVGARHSDWKQIHPDNVETDGKEEALGINQQKTQNKIFVPIHPVVKKIWRQYGGNPPKVISSNKLAEDIRAICKDADLGEKYTAISTHTARRSFATNSYLAGMDVHQIMNCTGHKTEASFLNYLKLEGKDKARLAGKSKFFEDGESWSKFEPQMKIA
ncbi:MAG TPA: phage integrase SAM-like domain-containing protein [Cyclobacteriaceae bacterium]|nr:phage integrase SAM-like domain-containing protein [Cyclobacteriaceae bacterium]